MNNHMSSIYTELIYEKVIEIMINY